MLRCLSQHDVHIIHGLITITSFIGDRLESWLVSFVFLFEDLLRMTSSGINTGWRFRGIEKRHKIVCPVMLLSAFIQVLLRKLLLHIFQLLMWLCHHNLMLLLILGHGIQSYRYFSVSNHGLFNRHRLCLILLIDTFGLLLLLF